MVQPAVGDEHAHQLVDDRTAGRRSGCGPRRRARPEAPRPAESSTKRATSRSPSPRSRIFTHAGSPASSASAGRERLPAAQPTGPGSSRRRAAATRAARARGTRAAPARTRRPGGGRRGPGRAAPGRVAFLRNVATLSNSRKRACSGSSGCGAGSPGTSSRTSETRAAMSAAPGPISAATVAGSRSWT